MATLPFVTPFPVSEVRRSLSAKQWEFCIQTWLDVLQQHLLLAKGKFEARLAIHQDLTGFLVSYVREKASLMATSEHADAELRLLCFRLIHRCLSLQNIPQDFLCFSFLSDLCLAYSKTVMLKPFLERLWTALSLHDFPTMIESRRMIVQTNVQNMNSQVGVKILLRRIAAMMRFCSQYGRFLMSGNDVFDWLIKAWSEAPRNEQSTIVKITYLGLKSLMDDQAANVSLLLDHLYGIKESAHEKTGDIECSLFTNLCLQTPIVQVLEKDLPANAKSRARTILSYMRSIRSSANKSTRGRKFSKATVQPALSQMTSGIDLLNERGLAVKQICDMFPNVDIVNATELLERHSNSVELVITALLDGTVLHDNATQESPVHGNRTSSPAHASGLQNPQSYTGDYAPRRFAQFLEQDDLTKYTGKLHRGNKDNSLTDSGTLDKTKIYSALAAFDLDDDEHDDTYDVQDVGGSIDVQGYDKDREETENERQVELLYRAWRSNSSLFDRHRSIRQSPTRQILRQETGMTDEAIEGFAIMLSRDRTRIKRLELKYPEFTGEQKSVDRSAWKPKEDYEDPNNEQESKGTEGEAEVEANHKGNSSIPTANSATIPSSKSHQDSREARQRKNEKKASRANHNRKAGYARKLMKAGISG